MKELFLSPAWLWATLGGALLAATSAWLSARRVRRRREGLVAPALAEKAKLNGATKKFLGLLAENGRARDLPGVIAGFQALHAKLTGVVAAEVVSALPLSAAQTKSIQSALRASLGRDPELTARVDPSILGGLKVKVGSKLFDASLKTKLDQMKFALKRA